MIRIMLVLLACGLLSDCSNTGGKQKSVAQNPNEIDVRPYFFPKTNLQQHQVFEYVNDATGEKMYYRVDLSNTGNGYVVNSTMYNDSLHKMAVETDSIGETNIAIKQIQLAGSEASAKDEISTDNTSYPWRQLLTDAPNFSTSYSIKSGEDQYKITSTHHFSKTATPNSQFYYKGQDCIKDMVENELNSNGAISAKKLLISKEAFYYAKDVGLIYYETTDFLNRKVTNFRLNKVMTADDFNKKGGCSELILPIDK